eukprot:4616145-Amphidinium_carterae.1
MGGPLGILTVFPFLEDYDPDQPPHPSINVNDASALSSFLHRISTWSRSKPNSEATWTKDAKPADPCCYLCAEVKALISLGKDRITHVDFVGLPEQRGQQASRLLPPGCDERSTYVKYLIKGRASQLQAMIHGSTTSRNERR